MATKLLANQLRSISSDPVEGFTVELADESSLFEWRVWLEGPKDTCYEGGVFQLQLTFPKDYPMSPPVLKFISDFWHPNVYADGKVCMSILHAPGEDQMSGERPEERWLPTQGVATIVLSLMSLLNDPNCSSPANVDASVEWRRDREGYKARCRKLVEKANSEKPSHVVIPHPDSNADEKARVIQKMQIMNKELDYDEFYDNDANDDDDDYEGDGDDQDEDEDEFSESEPDMDDDKNEDSESEKEVTQEKAKGKEKENTVAADDGATKNEETKKSELKEEIDKGKGKATTPEDKNKSKDTSVTESKAKADHENASGSSSRVVADTNNNNTHESVDTKRKMKGGRKLKRKKEKCTIM